MIRSAQRAASSMADDKDRSPGSWWLFVAGKPFPGRCTAHPIAYSEAPFADERVDIMAAGPSATPQSMTKTPTAAGVEDDSSSLPARADDTPTPTPSRKRKRSDAASSSTPAKKKKAWKADENLHRLPEGDTLLELLGWKPFTLSTPSYTTGAIATHFGTTHHSTITKRAGIALDKKYGDGVYKRARELAGEGKSRGLGGMYWGVLKALETEKSGEGEREREELRRVEEGEILVPKPAKSWPAGVVRNGSDAVGEVVAGSEPGAEVGADEAEGEVVEVPRAEEEAAGVVSGGAEVIDLVTPPVTPHRSNHPTREIIVIEDNGEDKQGTPQPSPGARYELRSPAPVVALSPTTSPEQPERLSSLQALKAHRDWVRSMVGSIAVPDEEDGGWDEGERVWEGGPWFEEGWGEVGVVGLVC